MNRITLPGSKSITNRDLILAALSNGASTLHSILESDDTHYMIEALKKLGIQIEKNGSSVTIHGGLNKIQGNDSELFLGNSGTSTRFLTGLAVLNKKGSITITGIDRMQKRPIDDLENGIKELGVKTESNNGCPPITIFPSEKTNNEVNMIGTKSSQYFTALLQIAPLLPNGLKLNVIGDLVSKPYIDITTNEMKKFGVDVKNNDYKSFEILPQEYIPYDGEIEGDASALSYFAEYVILHGGELTISNIGSNTKQGDYKLLDELKIFGLSYDSDGTSTLLKSSGLLNTNLSDYNNFTINLEKTPDAGMTFIVLAMFLPGKTHITGLQTLNLKECKRIDALRDEMIKLGVEVTSTQDSITVGTYSKSDHNVEIKTYDDHRIAMIFGTLGTYISGLIILDPDCVNKTYPNFWKDIKQL